MSRFLEYTEEFTFFSVHGLSVQSDFTVDVAITVTDTIGQTTHEQKFPLTIRSPKNGEFINDLDTLGGTIFSPQNLTNKYEFIDPFALPGCNFNVKLAVN